MSSVEDALGAALRPALGRPLLRAVYWCLHGETDGTDLDSADFYLGGEVELHFSDTKPIVLTWAENAGWEDHFSLQVRLSSAFKPDTLTAFDASSLSIWKPVCGSVLNEISVLGWEQTPHVARLDFSSGCVLVGTSYQTKFGGGDDVLIQRFSEAAIDGAGTLWTLGLHSE